MVRKRALAAGALASLVAGAAARVVYERRSSANAPYETVGSVGGAELRRYPTGVVVDTVAPSEHQAFGRLIRYASGRNESGAAIEPFPSLVSEGEVRRASEARSRPVSVTASDQSGEPVSVTAPRGAGSAEDGVRIAFYLPETYDYDSTPRPSDPNVRVVELPERTLAVRRLPRWTVGGRGGRVGREFDRLLSAVRAERAGVQVVGDPFVLRYDGPGASSVLRPNEVAVEVRRVASESR
jgi:hypothetical protein